MTYYKAKIGGVQDSITGYRLREDELLTPDERVCMYPTISDNFFDQVDIPKENTYWLEFCGVRFQKGEGFLWPLVR